MGKMKTLLRKIPTGLYFQGPDKWTSNPVEARDFQSIDRALEFVRTWKLDEVELAFAFGNQHVKGVPLEKTALPYSED
jgi:hypothetical protein